MVNDPRHPVRPQFRSNSTYPIIRTLFGRSQGGVGVSRGASAAPALLRCARRIIPVSAASGSRRRFLLRWFSLPPRAPSSDRNAPTSSGSRPPTGAMYRQGARIAGTGGCRRSNSARQPSRSSRAGHPQAGTPLASVRRRRAAPGGSSRR